MDNQKKLTVTLETVTPLFLGGAEAQDRNKPPELRPPAFRGALRYWLQAVLGSVAGGRKL
jgi:CRISPR-associated protein Cmr1